MGKEQPHNAGSPPADTPPAAPVPPGSGAGVADGRRAGTPGEDAGTLTDEEYLAAGGPDAIDSATLED